MRKLGLSGALSRASNFGEKDKGEIQPRGSLFKNLKAA
jgi:hypothetical protein